jgi:hypothetical protein
MDIDFIDRYPFNLDTVQSPIRPETPVAFVQGVLFGFAATPVRRVSALFHVSLCSVSLSCTIFSIRMQGIAIGQRS